MYIVDALSLSAAAKDAIAVSLNNADWDYIDKRHITKMTGTFMAFIKTSVANRNYKYEDMAIVEVYMGDHIAVKFDVQDVINQTTWYTASVRAGGTAATTRAGLNTALLDLEKMRSA